MYWTKVLRFYTCETGFGCESFMRSTSRIVAEMWSRYAANDHAVYFEIAGSEN